MADPFEVRLRFSSLLTHLTASTTSAQKTASYALKHRDMDEDLHSCILEALESSSTNMNSRANIMYFLEHFCDVSMRSDGGSTASATASAGSDGVGGAAGGGHEPYVAMIRRDIRPIVGAVVGSGKGVSGANIKVARKVVGDMGLKGYLEQGNVSAIEGDLKRREEERAKILAEEAAAATAEQIGEPIQDGEQPQGDARTMQSSARPTPRTSHTYGHAHGHGTSHGKDGRINGISRTDKKAIEQRIEEDRERNKRLRESVWAVHGDDEEELNRLWEETSDLCDEDYALGREEMAERRQFADYHRVLLMEGVQG